MPMIKYPQAPLRPGIRARFTWTGSAGAEVLTVEVYEVVTQVAPQTGTKTVVEQPIATIDYDFSVLGPADEWAGVALPQDVREWANPVVRADRADDETLTVWVVDWSRPDGQDILTEPLPWEV